MSQTYADAEAWLGSLGRHRVVPGLDRIARLLQECGVDPASFQGLLVAGTNGKGSTVAMAAAVLNRVGLTVGTFPSPHLQSVRERIRVDGRPVDEPCFAHLATTLRRAVEVVVLQGECPTEFETILAMALVHFAREGVDVIAGEVGLGGLLDATNVLSPKTKVITSIGMDHMGYLGDSLASIAVQKAGILRRGDTLLLGHLPGEADDAIAQVAGAMGDIDIKRLGHDLVCTPTPTGVDVAIGRSSWAGLQPPLLGQHQLGNLALAIGASADCCRRLGLPLPTQAHVEHALMTVRWPGRLEVLEHADKSSGWAGVIVLDGAHNVEALQAIMPELVKSAVDGAVVVLSMMQDKQWGLMADILPHHWRVVPVQIDAERGVSAEMLSEALGDRAVSSASTSMHEALAHAFVQVGPGQCIIVTGSLYAVGAARDELGLLPG